MPNGDKAMRLDEGKTLYEDLARRIRDIPSIDNVVAVTDVEPTEEGVKIWLPETPPQAIQVPTYAEFQQLETTVGGKVADVQVNGTSVVNNGVANIPVATSSTIGAVMPSGNYGIQVDSSTGDLRVKNAGLSRVKAGTNAYEPIVASHQHESVFYGLAKAAGSDMASSSNEVGTYTAEAKTAIQTMLDVPSASNPVFIGSISMGRAENTTVGEKSTAIGTSVTASGAYSHAEGYGTTASGNQGHAEGGGTTASGSNSHSEGAGSQATNSSAHAEGTATTASGDSSHSEGSGTTASAYNAHAEGGGTTASGSNSHAEGGSTSATRASSHAEGSGTQANADQAHAEGSGTIANGSSSHSEGGGTIANGGCAHAEGSTTQANGPSSHAEGGGTIANGGCSHVGGKNNVPDDYSSWDEWVANTSYSVGDKVKRTLTENNETTVTGYICKTANNDSTFTSSKWNIDYYMNYVEIIGNGSASVPSNARTLDWDGNEELAGDLTVNKGKTNEVSVSSLQKNKASVIIDSTNGNPIVLTDGANSLPVDGMKIHFSPVQNLNGYDNPWPAGGGKNKFPITLTTQTKNGTTFTVKNDGVITVSGTPSEQTRVTLNDLVFAPETNYKFSMTGSATGIRVFCEKNDGTSTTYPTLTPSLNVITENTYKNFILEVGTTFPGTATELKMQLEAGTSVTDWAPYSNICPISGWTGINVQRTGKNRIPFPYAFNSGTSLNGITVTYDESGAITLTGSASSTTYFALYGGYPQAGIKPPKWMEDGKEYTISSGISTDNVRVAIVYYGSQSVQYTTSEGVRTFTAPIKSNYTEFGVFILVTANTNLGDGVTVYPQIEVGSSATPYERFGESYPITFPDGQTVYGGMLDAVTGVLTVDKQIYNLSDISWNKDTNRPGIFYGGITGREISSDVIACSTYLVTNTNISTSQDKSISGYPNYGGQYIFLRDTDFAEMTATEMKDAVTGQLVYELATPIEIRLDPITVQTLLGYNAIWSDANGTIELDYRADTKLFCQKNDTIDDVQVNGTSVVNNGVANIPVGSSNAFGVYKVEPSFGILVNNDGKLYTNIASANDIKAGSQAYKPIASANQHASAFYGLAKAAGDTTQASSSNAVGTYTPEAKTAIQTMLGVEQCVTFVETVTGTTPTIIGQPNVRYVCGELSLLTITPPSVGTITVIFKSGSTPTVLTLPNTVKFPEWVDISTLEANTTYELIITDGVYGGVMSWAD